MDDQERRVGADPGQDGVPGRPGRALIGWMGEADAALILAARQPQRAEDPALARRARAARDAVARRPTRLDQGDVVRPLPAELSAYARRLARSEQSALFLNEGWEILMVDLRRVCSLQPAIQSENAVERVLVADEGAPESIAQLTLPESAINQRTPIQYDDARKTWLLSAGNANLRLDGPFAGDVGGRKAVGFFVALASSFLQVARHHGRYVLRDGYHRSYGLLARGIDVVPACVRDFGTADLGVSAAMFAPEVYLGERPPVLADFLDDAVAADVTIPIVQKLLVIQALELAPMS
jgi:hypothetical protein